MKRLRLLILLLLLIPTMLLGWLLVTESGLQWAYQQAKPWLPDELKLQAISGRLIGPVTLQDIEFDQQDMLIKSDQLIFDWAPTALLTANIEINRLHIQSLTVVLPETDNAQQTQTQQPPTSLPEIHLPWLTIFNNVQIDDVIMQQGDQSFVLNQIKLNASSLFSQIDIKQLDIDADIYSLNISGKLKPAGSYHHDLKINWHVILPSTEKITGKGQLTGDIHKTRIRQQLAGPLQLTLDAELNQLLDQLSWRAGIDVTQFDVSRMGVDWPALSGALKLDANGDLVTAVVSGTLDGNYPELGAFEADFKLQRQSDTSILIDHLKLLSAANNTQLNANGLWKPGDNGGDIQLTLDWQNLRWPIQNEAWFNSASGSGMLEGNIDQYKFKLSSDSPWPELLPSTWNAMAEGNLQGLNIQSLRVSALKGEAIASGRLNWSPELNWQADISARDIDPGMLQAQWPGKLEAKLSSKGRFENGELIANADITRLAGSLRGYPVSLRSQLGWRDNGIDITRFNFASGESTLSAEGRVGENLKLDWNIKASNLAELYPQAQGRLDANGRLSGPQLAPTIEASFKGSSLSMPGYQIGGVDGTLSVDLFKWQQLDINLAAQALKLNSVALQSLTITSADNRLEAKAVSEILTAQLELQGKPDANGWQGRIEKADVSSQRFNDWHLKKPAAISMTANSLQAQPLCWVSIDSTLCMTLQGQGDNWQAQLDAKQIPLKLFAPWLPPELVLEGNADATAELRLQAPNQLLGHASIKLPAGVLSYPVLEGERDRWEYLGGSVTVELDEQGITAKSELAMSSTDQFQLKAELPGAQLLTLDLQQQSLRADAQLTVNDLGLFEAVIPEVQDLKGEVALSINATGTLAQPRLSGRAHLLNGNLRIPRLGLNIDQLSLKSQSGNFEKVNFSLDAHSGDGTLAIQGQTTLDSNAGWPTEISIKGNEFEVSRIPEARVQVSPDLQVSLKQRRLDIQGEVHIPYAKLQPTDVTTASRVSDDAVIIGGDQIADEVWLLHTRVRLTLGERVSFYGFGFEGRLGGSLLLEDEPGQLTRATGEINIPEGRYRAYGQRLDVEHGRLIYTGGPLTNPGLDLQAVRHVDTVTAGIRVRGSLNQPQLELFSIPAMGQTDTLAYMLLGGPIENASGEEGAMMAKAALALGLSGGDTLARSLADRFGLDDMRVESNDTGDQASLVVGRYLSPKLYVSYGVGLVEAINTLTLRYKISDKWQLKAESGEYQGADFLYTIER